MEIIFFYRRHPLPLFRRMGHVNEQRGVLNAGPSTSRRNEPLFSSTNHMDPRIANPLHRIMGAGLEHALDFLISPNGVYFFTHCNDSLYTYIYIFSFS